MKLSRHAGLFVKIRGSESVVHFGAINLADLKIVADLYEVVLFRKLRRALSNGLISQAESSGASLGLVLASAVTRIIGARPRSATTITHLNETCGPLLEALRLLRAGGGREARMHYRAFIPNLEHVRYFRAFNEVIAETEPDITTDWISTKGRLGPVPILAADTTLAVVDLFKTDSSSLFRILDRQFSADAESAPLLIVARVALESGIEVTDVTGLSYVLPSLAQIADWCEGREVTASYLLLEDFDRDFLLPFEGRYSVCLLYVTVGKDPEFRGFGFRAIGDSRHGGTQLPAVVETVTRQRNYDLSFNAKLPHFEAEPEPDWRAWAEERAWDPAPLNWSGGPSPGDPFVFAVRSEKTPDVMECFAQLARVDVDAPQLGSFGLLQTAVCATDLPIVDRVSMMLRAVERENGDPMLVEFLARNLHDATKTRRSGGTATSLADLVRVFPAIGWTTPASTASTLREAAGIMKASPDFMIRLEAALDEFNEGRG